MKFFYSLIAFVLFTGYLSAQTLTKQTTTYRSPLTPMESGFNYSGLSDILSKRAKSPDNLMPYNYATVWHDSLFPGDYGLGLRADFLFPDTNIRLQYIQGWVGPQIHSVAIMLDPSAPIFKSQKIDTKKPYKVDSVVFPCAYFRKLKNEEADTLYVEVVTGYTQPVFDLTGGDLMANYGVTKLSYLDLLFNPPTLNINRPYLNYVYDSLKIKSPTYYRYKYIMTAKDTSSISPVKLTEIIIPTPDIKADTGYVAINVYFKPGYDYLVKDDLRKKNYVQFFSRAQKGVMEFPIYNPGDWNCSYIIHTWFMDPNPNVSLGLYGYFVAPWLFGRPWYYDNHLIDTYLSVVPDGVSDISDNSLTLSQNVPNPASDNTIINYELKKAGNVTLKITDISGREIANLNKGMQNAGKHNISLNTSKFAAGVYYYTLTTDNSKLTKKMIIE